MSGNVVDTTVGSSKDFRGTKSSSHVDAGDEYASASTTNMPKKKKKKLSYCVGIISVLVILSGAAALSFGLFTETSTQTAGQSIHLGTDTELLLGGDEKTTLHEETTLSSHLRRGTNVNNRGLDECNCELIRHRRTLFEEGLAEEQDSDVNGCDCSDENLEVEEVGYLCHLIHSLYQ